MVEVKLESVTKKFGNVTAVDDLNLIIDDGEFVALLGPSGCGKTTTLLMIAGIYKPTSGLICFDNQVVNDIEPKDRKIGMVFQSYALYPHMTVFDNIAFPLKLKNVPKDIIKRKVKEVAEILRIERLLDRKPAQLSGGQQQRVALARALAKEPLLFLMDEPLSNLDAKLRIEMRGELKRLQKELKITTIYVTHDQIEAMTMADRVAVMDAGKLQQFGSPEELYDNPSNTFVAGFIGSPPMNLIEASLIERDNTLLLDMGPTSLTLEDKMYKLIKELKVRGEVIMGIRPEDIEISDEGIEGEVYITEPTGKDLLIDVKLGGNLKIKVLSSSRYNLRMGDKVKLKINQDKLHIFKKNGEAIS